MTFSVWDGKKGVKMSESLCGTYLHMSTACDAKWPFWRLRHTGGKRSPFCPKHTSTTRGIPATVQRESVSSMWVIPEGYCRATPQILTWSFKFWRSTYPISAYPHAGELTQTRDYCWILGTYLEKSLLNWLISELTQELEYICSSNQKIWACSIEDHNLNIKMQSSCNHDHSLLSQIHKL